MIKRLIRRGIGAGMPLLILTTVINAEEMDHSQHQMAENSEQQPMDHSQHQMMDMDNGEEQTMDHSQHQMMDHSQHASHDTGSAKHIHHEHGKSGWMVEYKFMRMEMDGLLNGSNKVSADEVSGAQMQMVGGNMVMDRLPGKDYMMAPTNMTMDMQMLMGMYGFSQKFSMMFMGQYIDNDMDMVMLTYDTNGNRTPQNDTRPNMKTSGLGDTEVTAMYNVDKHSTVSFGLSLPTGSIDERAVIMMGNSNVFAPYYMQLGSGTYDLIPSYTYTDKSGPMAWGAQLEYTYRPGSNDNDYTLGDRFEVTGWIKHKLNSNFMISGRVEYADWQNVSGVATTGSAGLISPEDLIRMSPTYDPNAQGGTRTNLLLGINGMFGMSHMIGAEIGFPITQSLDGPQMAEDYTFSFAYQYMKM